MVNGLREQQEDSEADSPLVNPVLPEDILEGKNHHLTFSITQLMCYLCIILIAEDMRGNIRNVDHFIAFLYRFVEYIKKRLRTQNEESPARFLQDIRKEVGIDQKTLRFFSSIFHAINYSLSYLRCLGLFPSVWRLSSALWKFLI